MENSFFEYRDKTGADSVSDAEVIDDSLVLQSVPYSVKKKNRTAFVAESDDSISNDDDSKEFTTGENASISIARRFNAAGAHVICSSEDEDYSPELVPKRRPHPQIPIKPNESLILQRTKKRMLFQESDSDNSILIEQKHNNKQKCLKDTPLKIEGKSTKSDVNKSMNCDVSCDGDDNEDESDDDASEPHSSTDIKKKCKKLVISSDESSDDEHNHTNTETSSKSKKLVINSDESSEDENDASNNHTNTETRGKSKKLVINSDDENDDASINHTNTETRGKSKKLVFNSDESSDNENDASNNHTNTETRGKSKKLVINSDDENDDASINHTNTETRGKSKKLVFNSDESSDNENDASNNHTNTETRGKSKKLVINSDDENDDASINHTNTETRGKSKKLVFNSDESSDNENDASNNHTNTETRGKSKKLVFNSDDENDDAPKKYKNSETSSKSKNLVINSDEENDPEHNHKTNLITSDESDQELNSKAVKNANLSKDSHKSDHDYSSNNNTNQNTDDVETDDDDGPDEDMMVMSRATRMSIMGVIPKDNDSDESDYIQSDSSSRKTAESRAVSLEDLNHLETHKTPQTTSDDDLPEVTINQTQAISIKTNKKHNKMCDDENEISINSNDSRLSCSPFSSPLQDITNKSIEKTESRRKSKVLNSKKMTEYMDLTVLPDMKPEIDSRVIDLSNELNGARNKMLDKSASLLSRQKFIHNDDDVTIIDTRPEIIALSSDEDEVEIEKSTQKAKSPVMTASHAPKESMKQYLAPSRAGQVVYVKKHVKENEYNKLMRMKEDLNSVRMLLDEMELDTLPDGGSRLRARHRALEDDVRRQGDKVANMLVEPDDPTAADIAKDGFDAGLSWEDIQKASNAVQPRMFGKQAMATHMAERNLTIERLRDLHASLGSRPDESSLAAAPRLLRSVLMPYQRHALAWLQWRETQKPASGILADDMGLGKTITMISLIASDKQDKIDHGDDPDEGTARDKLVRGGTLVVCPASLIQQWASEVTKHCAPHAISVCLHHGAARATQPHRLAMHDMVATTYNILQRDSDKNGVLMRIQWRRVILDEAHIVRNHKSATSTAVSSLHGRRRWCLTGTPVQNKDLDLFALLKFLRLSPFDELQMWKKWIDNKSQGGQERLNIIMQCILLRRTKVQLQANGQLACLPSRTAHTRLVTLTSDEMNVYQKVLVLSKSLFAQFLHQRAEKNSGATTFTAPRKDSEYDKMHKRMIALQGVTPVKSHEILVLLLRLRQVCCHCGLIGSMLDEGAPGAEPEAAGADLLRELDKLSLEDSRRKSRNEVAGEEEVAMESAKADEAIRAVLAHNHPVFQLERPSSKIAAVMSCLQEHVFTTKGDKAVVVSQWTSVLRLVEQELKKKKIRSVMLSGAVPVPMRPKLIDLVNDPKTDVRVMLLSLCAGGVGINLCGANHLLLLDPHWNPQLEEQAQDRIYRVGQNKPVHIYRFVCVDTVEQTIRKLQEAKLQLADNVLTGAGNAAGSPLSVEELKMMFNMGS